MSETLARVEASWNDLLRAVEGIPEERLSERGAVGDWSVKDVLGHVTYWDGRVPDILKRMAPRDATTQDDGGDGGGDFEPINQREATARAGWTARQIRDELVETHASVIAALRAMPDVDPEAVAGNTYEHYAEHAAQIRAWRERGGV